MKDRFLIDSNVLVYAYDESDNLKHRVAGELFDEILSKDINCGMSVQNLSEFFVIITEKVKNKADKEIAQMIVQDLID